MLVMNTLRSNFPYLLAAITALDETRACFLTLCIIPCLTETLVIGVSESSEKLKDLFTKECKQKYLSPRGAGLTPQRQIVLSIEAVSIKG
jgi:hypothetical protein